MPRASKRSEKTKFPARLYVHIEPMDDEDYFSASAAMDQDDDGQLVAIYERVDIKRVKKTVVLENS